MGSLKPNSHTQGPLGRHRERASRRQAPVPAALGLGTRGAQAFSPCQSPHPEHGLSCSDSPQDTTAHNLGLLLQRLPRRQACQEGRHGPYVELGQELGH